MVGWLVDWVYMYYEALIINTKWKNRDKWMVVFDLMIPRRANVKKFTCSSLRSSMAAVLHFLLYSRLPRLSGLGQRDYRVFEP